MKKIMLLLFITAFVSVPASPQIVTQIVKRMDTHQKALKSLRANVTINKFSVQFGGTYTKEGAVKFIPANDYFLRLDSTKPATESFLVVKNQYLVYLPETRSANTGTMSDSLNNTFLIFAILSQKNIRANYNISYTGQEKLNGTIPTFYVILSPKSPTSFKAIELWVDINGMPIQSKIAEDNGDWMTVRLDNLQKNAAINNSDFKINLPKGTKINKN